MPIFASRLILIAALLVCGCGIPSSTPSRDQDRGSEPVEPSVGTNPLTLKSKGARLAGTYVGEWSAPVNGLSVRLLVTLQDRTNQSHWASPIILEVKNISSSPLAFINQPAFTDSAVRDSNSKALPETSVDGNQHTGEPQWAVIPGNTYLGIRVDTSIPVDYGLYFGLITPEAQSVTATLVAQHREGPENRWIGEIQVPPVLLTSSSLLKK